GDKQFGRKTLAILIGQKKAVQLLTLMFIVSYAWVFLLIFVGIASLWTALVLLSAPKAVQASKGFVGKTLPIQMMPAMKATAQTNTFFGFLLAIGLCLEHFL